MKKNNSKQVVSREEKVVSEPPFVVQVKKYMDGVGADFVEYVEEGKKEFTHGGDQLFVKDEFIIKVERVTGFHPNSFKIPIFYVFIPMIFIFIWFWTFWDNLVVLDYSDPSTFMLAGAVLSATLIIAVYPDIINSFKRDRSSFSFKKTNINTVQKWGAHYSNKKKGDD